MYPFLVPSWNESRGPPLDNAMVYWPSEDEFKRFVCLCPEPLKYLEAIRVNAPEIIDRLRTWTLTEEEIVAAQENANAAAAASCLQEIGYRHVSTIAMDSVSRDERLRALHFLYQHFSHGGYTMQAILRPGNRCHQIGNDNIIRFHLRVHGHADDHGAWDEATTAAYTQMDWLVDRQGLPPQRMCEDFKFYGQFLRANGWKEPIPRECRAGDFFYKRIVGKQNKQAEAS